MKKLILLTSIILIGGFSTLPALTVEEVIADYRALRNGRSSSTIDTSIAPNKCGLGACLNLLNIKDQISEAFYKQLIARPILSAIDTTKHFVIHYATAGVDTPYQASVDLNGNGVPDFVDSTAIIFEHVWTIEIDSLLYPQPPTDDTAGGNAKYDIYVHNLGSRVYGMTYPETRIGNSARYISYIEVDNDFRGIGGYETRPLEAMKVTAAHEFFHAIHFGLDSYEYDGVGPEAKPWWYEATSTWMEDVVYTDVNDYLNYLPYFFNYPWIGLGAYGDSGAAVANHPYASCVWPRYLDNRFGRDIIRQIWLNCAAVAGYNLLPATDGVLSDSGSSFEAAFREFCSWNYFTANRADTINKYKEADRWPQIKRRFSIAGSPDPDFGVYPVVDTILATDSGPQPLAANYIVFRPWRGYDGGLRFDFDGEDISGKTWAVAILGWKRGSDSLFTMTTSPGSGQGSRSIRDWYRYDSLVFIPGIVGLSPGYAQYGYNFQVSYDSNLVGNAPVFDSLPASVFVRVNSCADVALHAISRSGDSIHIYSDSLPAGATLTDYGDGSALLRFCATFAQTGQTISINVKAADTAGYDDRTIAFIVIADEIIYAEVYPNPVVVDNGDLINLRCYLSYTLASGKIHFWIFNAAGDLVYKGEEAIDSQYPWTPGFHSLPWDGKNDRDKSLAGGVYFIKVKEGHNSGTGKFAIVR
jgi:hypothetical protein